MGRFEGKSINDQHGLSSKESFVIGESLSNKFLTRSKFFSEIFKNVSVLRFALISEAISFLFTQRN